MYKKCLNLINNEKGSAAGSIFTVIFVMVVFLFALFMTTIMTSYMTYSRMIDHLEQSLNNSAAMVDALYEELVEVDQTQYIEVTDEMYDEFRMEFENACPYKTKDYEITNPKLTLRYSTEDEFAILYGFTGNIKIKVSLFGKDVDYIDKEIEIYGRHDIKT